LAALRDPDFLDSLPTVEREDWLKLWRDIDTQFNRTKMPKISLARCRFLAENSVLGQIIKRS
jgi:hypothetical protein